MLPDNVETCVDDFSDCGNVLNLRPRYCAYHSFFNIGGHGLTLWANEPYIGFAAGHCNSGSTNAAAERRRHRPRAERAQPRAQRDDHRPDRRRLVRHERSPARTATSATSTSARRSPTNSQRQLQPADQPQPVRAPAGVEQLDHGLRANFGAVAPTAAFTWSPPIAARRSTRSPSTGQLALEQHGRLRHRVELDFGDGGSDTGADAEPHVRRGRHLHGHADGEGRRGPDGYRQPRRSRWSQRPTDDGLHRRDDRRLPRLGHAHRDADGRRDLEPGRDRDGHVHARLAVVLRDDRPSADRRPARVVITQIPGAYTVTASFAGDSVYGPSSDTESFTITKEETTLMYTGPTVILVGRDDERDRDAGRGRRERRRRRRRLSLPPSPPGQTVTFTLDGQTCSGTTDATGAGELLDHGLRLARAEDDHGDVRGRRLLPRLVRQWTWSSSPSRAAARSCSATRRVAAATPLTPLTWWSHSWSSVNSLSGGTAPAAFKGFAANVLDAAGGEPGGRVRDVVHDVAREQPGPPADVPTYMGVLVASSVSQAGSTIGGSWAKRRGRPDRPRLRAEPGPPGNRDARRDLLRLGVESRGARHDPRPSQRQLGEPASKSDVRRLTSVPSVRSV